MRMIKIFIDYPLDNDNSYFGLSMPSLISSYLKSCEDFELITNENENFDILLVISGGSQYTSFNNQYVKNLNKKNIFNRLFKVNKIDYNRQNVRNLYYEQRIKEFKKKNKNLKIVQRLDGR